MRYLWSWPTERFDCGAPFHETIQSWRERVIVRVHERKHWPRTCIYFLNPHISLGLVHPVEQRYGQISTAFPSVLNTPKEGRGQ